MSKGAHVLRQPVLRWRVVLLCAAVVTAAGATASLSAPSTTIPPSAPEENTLTAAPRPVAAAVAMVAAMTENNAQTVKYASTQAELIAAIANYVTIVLTANILLENSTTYGTGIVIENVQGLVINGSGFAVDGQGMMRCMYVASADVALVDVTLTNGKAAQVNVSGYSCSGNNGGGLCVNNGGTANLTTSPVTNNTANAHGGGIYVYQGTATLTTSPVTDNKAYGGGGIEVHYGTATLTTSPVTGNTASSYGGGICVYDGEADCIGAHFEGNSPQDVYIYGSGNTFTASPCPDGYESTIDGTLHVHGGSGTYDSYTCTDPTAPTHKPTEPPTRKPTEPPTRKPTLAPTAPLLVCSDNSTCTAPCEKCCVDYLLDQASCNACVEEECTNSCSDDSTCNVCEACCVDYLDQASCDACAEAECTNICSDNSTCTVCEACCVDFIKDYIPDQASCDACTEEQC